MATLGHHERHHGRHDARHYVRHHLRHHLRHYWRGMTVMKELIRATEYLFKGVPKD